VAPEQIFCYSRAFKCLRGLRFNGTMSYKLFISRINLFNFSRAFFRGHRNAPKVLESLDCFIGTSGRQPSWNLRSYCTCLPRRIRTPRLQEMVEVETGTAHRHAQARTRRSWALAAKSGSAFSLLGAFFSGLVSCFFFMYTILQYSIAFPLDAFSFARDTNCNYSE